MKSTSLFLIALLMLSFAYPSWGQTTDSGAAQILNGLVENDKDEIINSTQELIKVKSVAGEPKPGAPFGEGPAQALDKALEIAEGLGFNTTNLDGYVGYAEFGQGEEYVAVLAHMDVVPEGEGWTYPPYGAEIHDGKIYGRGAIDDKGPAVASLYALKAVKDSNLSISKRVRVIFGTDEETDSKDMEYYLEREAPPVAGFTPDGNFPAIYAEKGILTLDIVKEIHEEPADIRVISIESGTAPNIVPNKAVAVIETSNPAGVAAACNEFSDETGYNLTAAESEGSATVASYGVAAHGSMPYKGKNAAMQLMAFLGTLDLGGSEMGDALGFLNDKIGMETDGRSLGLAMEDEESGNLTLNVGIVNATEDRIALSLNIRYPVTHTSDEVLGIMNGTLEGSGFRIEGPVQVAEPLYYPEDSPLIKTLTDVYNRETGHNDSAIAVGGGTYAKHMPNIVASGPMMPGQDDVEHQPDEYISVDQLIEITKIYAQDIYELAR